jgi:hypothetical protein
MTSTLERTLTPEGITIGSTSQLKSPGILTESRNIKVKGSSKAMISLKFTPLLSNSISSKQSTQKGSEFYEKVKYRRLIILVDDEKWQRGGENVECTQEKIEFECKCEIKERK